MGKKIDFELMIDPSELASYRGWSEEVYRDLLAIEDRQMTEAVFDQKYLSEKAILVLDLTGFTETAMRKGAIHSFLRILDAHKLCLPVLSEHSADFVRVFADDIVALAVARRHAVRAPCQRKSPEFFTRHHQNVASCDTRSQPRDKTLTLTRFQPRPTQPNRAALLL